MGGLGSGTHWQSDKKDMVEDFRFIDVRRLQRDGILNPGYYCNWAWWDQEGNRTASIGIYSYRDKIKLVYTINPYSDNAEEISYYVPLTYTGCNYGNSRPWFICPGENCGRQVAILYLKGSRYLCRHCNNLTYACQQETEMFRLLSKAQKIRVKLGGSGSTADLFPPKPKYMHKRTYERLREKSLNAQFASWHAANERFDLIF